MQALEVHLQHARPPATRLTVDLAAPTRDARRLLDLLTVRLVRGPERIESG